MLALAAVSDEIAKYPMVKDRLEAYAGPQCYAHLDKTGEDYRVRANERRAQKAESADGKSVASAAVLDPACWLRCDNEKCGKWRLVHQNCLRAFRSECHFREEETDRDWEWWLQQAPSRYERFLRKHVSAAGGDDAERLEEFLECNAESPGEIGVADVTGDAQAQVMGEDEVVCGVFTDSVHVGVGAPVGVMTRSKAAAAAAADAAPAQSRDSREPAPSGCQKKSVTRRRRRQKSEVASSVAKPSGDASASAEEESSDSGARSPSDWEDALDG